MGGDPTYDPPPGEFPPQGIKKDVGDATTQTDIQYFGISFAVRCLAGGGMETM